jgi:CRP/FNR family cyclic AMP-dependent transcriptional regulator
MHRPQAGTRLYDGVDGSREGTGRMSRGEAGPPRRSVLALDPDLGQLLPAERRDGAERELLVRVTSVATGEWDGARLAGADPGHVGLLVVEGVMAREVVVGDTVSTELLGPGDVIRPWQLHEDPRLLPVEVRWNALSPVRLAVLDRRFAAHLGRYPEVNAVLIDRLSDRAQRLAITQAISQLNRVDRRLIALFWHLAERWGRVVADGVAVPLTLSHRLLGQLVGARRPTVSTALADLARDGQVLRRGDGTWLLKGEPVGVPAPVVAEVVRQRRRLVPQAAPEPAAPVLRADALQEPASPPAARAAAIPAAELRETVARLRGISEVQGEQLKLLCEQAAELRERSLVLRDERRQRRQGAGQAPLSA